MHNPECGLTRQLVELMQAGLPVCDEPYVGIATALGITENQLLERLGQLLADGTIRRIGLVPNHYALGYSHNLMSVWDVDDARVEELGRAVGALSFVSHCYRRPRCRPSWPYNLFAMIHCKNEAHSEIELRRIEELLGDACHGFCQLKSKRILKKSGLRIQREVP